MGNFNYSMGDAQKSHTYVNDIGQLYQEITLGKHEEYRVLGYNHIVGLRFSPGLQKPEFKCRYVMVEDRNKMSED